MTDANGNIRPWWRAQRVRLLPAAMWLAALWLRGNADRRLRTCESCPQVNSRCLRRGECLRDRLRVPAPCYIRLQRFREEVRPTIGRVRGDEVWLRSAGA